MKYNKHRPLTCVAALFLIAAAMLSAALPYADAAKLSKSSAKAPESAEAAKAPTLEMFAAKIALNGPKSTLLSAVLPESFYQHSEDNGTWRDLCVFDATGTPIPFTVKRLPPINVPARAPLSVPFFKWTTEDDSLPTNSNIKINAKGTVIEVKESGSITTNKKHSNALLLDFTALPEKPWFIELVLEDEPVFNSNVKVSYSNDLNSWSYDNAQSIYSSGKGNGKHNLALTAPDASYILISPGENTPAIKEIIAKFSPSVMPTKMNETIITGTLSQDKKSIIYDTRGHFPISYINFVLKEPDALKILLSSTNNTNINDKNVWDTIRTSNIFLMEEKGSFIKNDPMRVRSTEQFWKLEALGNVPFASAPEMHILWEPTQLIFLARGQGPWLLAYGNKDYKYTLAEVLDKEALDEAAEGVIDSSNRDKVTITPTQATLGAEEYTPHASNPSTQPQAEPDSGNLKNVILWVVLVVAVLVLCGLALKLYKGMNKGG